MADLAASLDGGCRDNVQLGNQLGAAEEGLNWARGEIMKVQERAVEVGVHARALEVGVDAWPDQRWAMEDVKG